DNVAAAFHGGFVVAAGAGDPAEVLSCKASVPAELDFIVVTPNIPIPTSEARAILPKMYSRADVVNNLQRALLLAAQCFTGQFDLTQEVFRDRLHQPYRSRLIPGLGACLEVQHPGLAGVFVSGAGSSVLAIARQGADEIAELLVETFRRKGVEAQKRLLKADNRGAFLTVEAVEAAEGKEIGEQRGDELIRNTGF
ncbi:MAG: homoserine kinase, partial [Candidatus Acidiferrales bacterium]